jgi:hypothetical protein
MLCPLSNTIRPVSVRASTPVNQSQTASSHVPNFFFPRSSHVSSVGATSQTSQAHSNEMVTESGNQGNFASTCTHIHMAPPSAPHAHPPARTRTRAHAHARACTMCTRTHVRVHTHTHTHPHTHTCTYTRAQPILGCMENIASQMCVDVRFRVCSTL